VGTFIRLLGLSACIVTVILVGVFLLGGVRMLTNKMLLFFTMPPVTTSDNLPDSGVVIASTNVKLEEVRVVLWFYLCVLMIDHLEELLNHFHVDEVQEVRLLQLSKFENDTIASWHWHIEKLQ